MDLIVKMFHKPTVQLWATLVGLMGIIFLIKDFMSLILLIVIFSFVAHVGINKIRQYLKVNQPVGTLIFYVILLVIAGLIFTFTASAIYDQLKGVPDVIKKVVDSNAFSSKYFKVFLTEVTKNNTAVKGSQYLAISGLTQLGRVGVALEHIIIALLLSLVFNLTYNHLAEFGRAVLNSKFKVLFHNVYYLLHKYVMILGTVIETQLIICCINTVLMVMGLWIIGIPRLLLLAIIVFVLGLVPVAGVIISLFPLGLVAYSSNGWVAVLEVLILVGIIHLFESYFLHPRLMAGATDLPIFITFVTLIIAAKMLGTWGLIVGIPTVAFFIDLLGVKLNRHHLSNKPKDVIEREFE